jgi:hypothetical protein
MGRNNTMIAPKLSTFLLVAATGLMWLARPAHSAEKSPVPPQVSAAPSSSESSHPARRDGTPEGAPGMRVYVDPETGRFEQEPPRGRPPLSLSPQAREALSTSHEGLAEVPSKGPAGGFKLNLKGRFRSPLFVTVDAHGKLGMQHLDDAPETHNKK